MNNKNDNLKLLAGLPEKTAKGGINACEPPFLNELEKLGIGVTEIIYSFDNAENISFGRRIRQVLRTASDLKKILQTRDFDVFHINTAFIHNALLRDIFILYRIRNRKTKIFLKFHGSDIGLVETRSVFWRRLIRYLIECADGIGVLSSEELRNFAAAGFDVAKFSVVKNAVTALLESPGLREFEISADRPLRLLFVARLIPTKGLLETVDAVGKLAAKGFNIHLDVLGDGETRTEAEDLSKHYGAENFITFHGHLSEERVFEFYRNSDVLVFPTFHHEGFPMVIFNAMAAGLPIVTTKIRAAADYLVDGENCFFCEPKNSDSVASKIETLYHDGGLRERMSNANVRLAKEFSAEKVAPEYLEIYRSIANRGSNT